MQASINAHNVPSVILANGAWTEVEFISDPNTVSIGQCVFHYMTSSYDLYSVSLSRHASVALSPYNCIASYHILFLALFD